MPRQPAEVPARLPSLSDQLAALIRAAGRTPAAIAAAADVAPSVVGRFLSGERGISSATFDRIASALGGLRLVPIGKARVRRGLEAPAVAGDGPDPPDAGG